MTARWPFAYGTALQTLTPPQGATAIESWWYERPSGQFPEIWCYTDEFSYSPGDEMTFRVHTTAAEYSVEIYRDGPDREMVHRQDGLEGTQQETPDDCSEEGCGWDSSFAITVPADWRSGGYVALLTATLDERTVRHEHWFAVRPAMPNPESILLIAATSTWIAYNAWGGSNHYEGIWGPDRNRGCPSLSTLRPWSRGMAWIPVGAPRLSTEVDVPVNWVPRYPALEWALGSGFPKYTAAAGWGSFETHFVNWAEAEGYQVDVITQHDLHFRPELLEGYRCVAIVGHNEYWSWEMRDHLDAYIDAGGRVAHFAGNFFWQVRLEEDGAVQVCHKYAARDEDQVRDDADNRHLLTSAWDDPIVGRPGAQTLGLTALRGMYRRAFGGAMRSSGGYTVYRPKHWIFDGCDLYYGDQLGASANVCSYEVDGLDYVIEHGLPSSTGKDGITPEQVEILAIGLAGLLEEDRGHDGTVLFSGDTEAVFVAEMLHGEATPKTVDLIDRGAGMIAEYERGDGVVLNTGSCEWVSGLRLHEPAVEQVTHNILRRFLSA